MRMLIVFFSLLVLQASIVGNVAAESVFIYEKPKVDHAGKEVTPLEAYAMIKKDPAHKFVVDVRTRGEYQFVGHPEGAVLIPFQELGTKFMGKGYEMVENTSFAKDILARFSPENDTLFILCRSGTR
ncbi:MAG: sulfurtransferase, partial [Deltaproteobacteria bacterium]|nr:sulfurtransferase [Deltaproteobacteria bacterium]